MKTLINYAKFLVSNKTSNERYYQMRSDYIVNKNKDADICSSITAIINPKFKISNSKGIIGDLGSKEVKEVSNSLYENGYYIFEKKLDASTVERIKSFMETVPVRYSTVDSQLSSIVNEKGYRKCADLGNRFDIADVAFCNSNKDLLDIIADENFFHISNEYLGSKPILDIVTLWWNKTIPVSLSDDKKNLLKNASAQMFHLDMDRLKFLKFFIFLTDVDEESGPHVYVKNTHKVSPDYITSDGRFTDDLIEANAGDKIVKICGGRGSIIAVDTRGLHKGMEVLKGERLIFQVEFTNSLFGNPEHPSSSLKLQIKPIYKKSYKLFLENEP